MPADEKDKAALARQVVEAVRQIGVHYGLWLAEAAHQFGPGAAMDMEGRAGDWFVPLLTKRLERALGLERPLTELVAGLGRERLSGLLKALSISWLAADGVWFRSVEDARGMHDAKRVNDTCWSRLALFEACRAKAVLGLPDVGGVPELRAALEARLVAHVNAWEFIEATETSVVYRILECRVQSARTRQGLAPYPCQSGGSVEYSAFAAGINPAFRVTCVSCPPEVIMPDCACAWRFSLDG